MESTSFSEIEPVFLERTKKMVWCNVATLDRQNRIRSRILHPIWEGKTGWIATRRTSHKAKHIARHPYVSLAYIADIANPVYVECTAEWADDLPSKQHVWDLFSNAPEPLGYDPTPIFIAPDHPDFGVLKLTPWRIELYQFPDKSLIWRSD